LKPTWKVAKVHDKQAHTPARGNGSGLSIGWIPAFRGSFVDELNFDRVRDQTKGANTRGQAADAQIKQKSS